METKTRDEVFTMSKKGHMSFEELIVLCDQSVIDKLLLTERFNTDKCFDFDIKINGISIDLETLKKYIDKKFVSEFERMNKTRAKLKEMEKNIDDEICEKARHLVRDKIEGMFMSMSNNLQEIEEKLIENNRECVYYWDDKFIK